MKNFVLLFVATLFCSHAVSGQTLQIERAHLNTLFKTGKINATQANERKRDFESIVAQRGGYPDLPYDSINDKFVFTYVLDVSGVPQKTLYRRIMEWCAKRYVDIDEALRYNEPESGKLIFKGYAEIEFVDTYEGIFGEKKSLNKMNKCFHTLIFTVKEGKVKIEFEDLRYTVYSWNIVGTQYPVLISSEKYFQEFFPVTENDAGRYYGILDLVTNTLNVYQRHIKDLEQYLKNWQEDYKF